MGFETDYAPIEYLQRRVKYYKKLRGKTKNWAKDEYLIKKYGQKKMAELSKSAAVRYELRIKEYENAISILQKHKPS
jgi:hypothetical protein